MMWALALIALAIALILLEAFLPSHGILGFLAALAVVAGIALGFYNGPGAGLVVLMAASVAVPASIAILVQVWPHTPIGRRMLITPPKNPEDVLPDTEEVRRMQKSVGKRGRAKSLMLPGGTVEIEGRRYDALSEGLTIEPETPVLVVAVRVNRLVVRPLDGAELRPQPASQSEQDLLAQPIDQLGLDPFEDPLA